MNSRKPLIVGAVMTVIVICFLIEILTAIVEQKQQLHPVLSSNSAILVGTFTLICTIGLLAFGVWGSLSRSTKLEILNKRYTLIAKFPVWFGFALLPVSFGLILIVLTDQTTWGFWLSCLSFPAVLIFLFIELRRLQN